MPAPIADALVLVLPIGVTLRAWETSGVLDRECALLEQLRAHYGAVYLVTNGGPDETQIAEHKLPWVGIICNHELARPAQFLNNLPARLVQQLADVREVLVKTTQVTNGQLAISAVRALRHARGTNHRVGLLASGERLPSRFVARDFGPHSRAAHETAERERDLCRCADVVAGTTRDMLDDLAWRYELDPAALKLVPNFVLDNQTEDAVERVPGLILSVGSFNQRKRFDVLIAAISALPETLRAEVTLRLIGGGPEEPNLLMLAAESGIKCEFLSRMPNRQVLEEMSKCAIYAQASDLEGHPRAVLEAMASGAAVVVADAPGLSDAVQSGVTGLRVSSDAAGFTHAIGALLADDDWRMILGSAASRMARSTFALSVVIHQELDAQRLAMSRCGLGTTLRDTGVRWDRSLLMSDTGSAAEHWSAGLREFESHLSEPDRKRFREGLSMNTSSTKPDQAHEAA